MGIGATAGVAVAGGFALSANASGTSSKSSGASDSLVFDKDAYTELTTTITDADGTGHTVVYHFWKAVTYVASPVDAKYQSLNVSVPVKIDGKAVDATNAPIVLANAVGGYMPSSVADATGVGRRRDDRRHAHGRRGWQCLSQRVGRPLGLWQRRHGRGAVRRQRDGERPGRDGQPREAGPGGGLRRRGARCARPDPHRLRRHVLRHRPGRHRRPEGRGRYVRANKGVIPGNTDRIVSTGTSAGGALSSLLGASGDSPIYDKYLKELGAADASDATFATGAWCPITDLEHADGAYEFNWGANVTASTVKVVDQTVSKALRAQFAEYQASLRLRGLNGFGPLTARNYDEYMVETYLQPSATKYLAALSEADRATYLAANTFITWSGGKATFTWADFLTHVGARKKTTPAFDAFDLSSGENNEFGVGTTEARHFTAYGAKNDTTGLATKRVASDIAEKLDLMNPMHHIGEENPGRSRHWWIRLGTKDSDTSLTVSANLAAALDNLGDDVNHLYYWDEGHGSNVDPGDFLTWIAKVTGDSKRRRSAK